MILEALWKHLARDSVFRAIGEEGVPSQQELIAKLKENGAKSYPVYAPEKPRFAGIIESWIERKAKEILPVSHFERDYPDIPYEDFCEVHGILKFNRKLKELFCEVASNKGIRLGLSESGPHIGLSLGGKGIQSCEYYDLGRGTNHIVLWHTHPGKTKTSLDEKDFECYGAFDCLITSLKHTHNRKAKLHPVIYHPYTNESVWYSMRKIE